MRACFGLFAAWCACGSPTRTPSSPDAGSGTSTVSAVALPQAIGGAMFVDPDAYPHIPVHVAITGTAEHVGVSIDGAAAVDASTGVADVDVSTLPDGPHALVADADGVQATATLVVGHDDIQLTQVGVDGNAGTSRLHRAGDHLYLTWTDASAGPRTAWLQEIDGAGRPIGTRVALAGGAGQPDVLYARTALGASAYAVLYQQTGGPYTDFFTIVAADGTVELAAMPLDGTLFGSSGGDVTYDGTSGFDVTWRTNDGMGNSFVNWMHVDEASGAVTGPLVIAKPGHDDPDGNFDPIISVSVAHADSASLVAFLRYEYDTTLGQEIDRCNIVTVTVANGTTFTDEMAGIGGGFLWDDDCRILAGGIAIWPHKDLTSSADDPPDTMVGARAGDPARGNGHTMVSAPESREEPFLVPTSASSILAWTDGRSYTNPSTGQTQLYAALVSDDLSTTGEVLFPRTHFIEGTGELRGAPAGTNAMLTWIDERHGGTVLDPKPEVYVETAWQ